jgi:putative acetyltransferase
MSVEGAIHRVELGDFANLIDVWEASVRATHRSVSEAYIQFFKPLARDQLLHLVELACVRDDRGAAIGFIGVADGKIEALFVHPAHRRRGHGRRLVAHAIRSLAARAVDVDEQDEALAAFYRHMGFVVEGRTAVDGIGKPIPTLHMRLRIR